MKKIRLIPILLLMGGAAYAECSRTDVNYYLKKGFSRAQVAAICGTAESDRRHGAADKDYEAYDEPVERAGRKERLQRLRDDELAFVRSAIDAWDVDLTPRRLDYTRKLCLKGGANSEVEARLKVCPDVRYRVYFEGLSVKGYQRKYLALGTREIEVEGKVKRKLMHDFKEYPSETRRLLLGSYRARTRKGGTFIPVRKDYPINRLNQILRKYARRAGAS